MSGELVLQPGEKAFFIQCSNCHKTYRVSYQEGADVKIESLHCKCGTVTPWRAAGQEAGEHA
jgi:hypothetical protein